MWVKKKHTQEDEMVDMKFTSELTTVKRESVIADPLQPRKEFNGEKLDELVQSIRTHGMMQPIVVQPNNNRDLDAEYIIIAGERRFRATGILEWSDVQVIVRSDIDAAEAAALQLLENIVRADLNPVEEAKGIQRLMDEGQTMQDISASIGMAVSQISWRLQMLNAREDVLGLVAQGHLKPAIAFEMSKLSHAGQGRVVHALNQDRLTYNEVVAFCGKVFADENQSEMFPDVVVSEEGRRIARTFADGFESFARQMTKLADMDLKNPGSMAEALSAEGTVVEAKIEESIKALYRVKKAMQTRRMHLMAGEVDNGEDA